MGLFVVLVRAVEQNVHSTSDSNIRDRLVAYLSYLAGPAFIVLLLLFWSFFVCLETHVYPSRHWVAVLLLVGGLACWRHHDCYYRVATTKGTGGEDESTRRLKKDSSNGFCQGRRVFS